MLCPLTYMLLHYCSSCQNNVQYNSNDVILMIRIQCDQITQKRTTRMPIWFGRMLFVVCTTKPIWFLPNSCRSSQHLLSFRLVFSLGIQVLSCGFSFIRISVCVSASICFSISSIIISIISIIIIISMYIRR